MINLISKSVVSLFLLGASCVQAGAAEGVFYGGSHVCNGSVTLDDWELRTDGATSSVFFRVVNTSSFQRLELTAQPGEGGLILSDRRGRPWLAVLIEQNGDRLQGRWLTSQGRPQSECEPFTLSRTESAKARMDRLFTLLGKAEPSVETARGVANGQQTLPPIELLPALDQKNYRQRYAEAAAPFWRRFYDAERKRLAGLPVEAPDAREQIVGEMRAATSLTLTSQGSLDRDGNALQAALDFLRIVADRLADSARPLKALPANELCERIATFSYIDTDRLELVVGLPVEYWDRPYTEGLIQKVQACRDGRTVVQVVSQSYPEIEKRGKTAAWLRGQRDRLLALPLTLKSLRETNSLQIGGEDLRRNDVSRTAYERFVGAPLESRRDEMERAAAQEIETTFSRADTTNFPVAQARMWCERQIGARWGSDALARLYKVCTTAAEVYVARSFRQALQAQADRIGTAPKTFGGLEANNWFLMPTGDFGGAHPPAALLREFNDKVAAARTEAVRTAVGEVDRAFAAADPTSDLAISPILHCDGSSIPWDESLKPLVEACRAGHSALSTRRNEALCRGALKASGANPALLEAMIRSKEPGAVRFSVRQLVCESAKHKISVSFPTSGMMWWFKQYVEARIPINVSDNHDQTFRWRIEQDSDKKGEWFVSKLESKTGNDVPLPVTEDFILPCLARQGICK